MSQQIAEMRKYDIIEDSNSEWGAPHSCSHVHEEKYKANVLLL